MDAEPEILDLSDRWIVLSVAAALLAIGPGCRDDEAMLGSDLEWWWELDVQDDEVRLDNREQDFALLVQGGSPAVLVTRGGRRREIPERALAPDELERGEMIHVELIRQVLLRGQPPEVGCTREIGGWMLYRTPAFFALRHPERPYILASLAESNGWLVSIDPERVGFVYPATLAGFLREE